MSALHTLIAMDESLQSLFIEGPPSAGCERPRWIVAWLAVALALAAILAYLPVVDYEFVRYDDPGYVTENPLVQQGLGVETAIQSFKTYVGGNWHPLTMISHMLDARVFGLSPGGHHGTNLCLHVLNTLLLFLILHGLTGATWRAALAAALFALHPLNAESVAWVSQRKTLLCTLFWFLGIGVYAGYVRRPSWVRYLLVFISLAAALMSKPAAVTFPFTLLLLDYWPLRRLDCTAPSLKAALPRLIIEKLPLVVLVGVVSVLAYRTQAAAGAVIPAAEYPLQTRLAYIISNYVQYIDKALWPRGLAVLYPRQPAGPAAGTVATGVAALMLFTAFALRTCRTHPYGIVGWCWFLGTLVPVIGIVMIGHLDVADRYAYIPLIGLFLIVAWGLGDAVRARVVPRWAVVCLTIVVLAALFVRTRSQLSRWRTSHDLFAHAVQVTRGNYVMHENLAREFIAEGRSGEALVHFEEAVRIKPDYVPARMNLALTLFRMGRRNEAAVCVHGAVRYFPDNAPSQRDLGMVFASLGEHEASIRHLARSVELDPNDPRAHYALATMYLRQKRTSDAIVHLERAASLSPDTVEIENLLKRVKQGSGSRPR